MRIANWARFAKTRHARNAGDVDCDADWDYGWGSYRGVGYEWDVGDVWECYVESVADVAVCAAAAVYCKSSLCVNWSDSGRP